MIIFPTGIKITSAEYQCLFYLTPDVEGWLRGAIVEKAKLRREALINEWRPKLFNDPDVTELPADSHALCNLIMSRTDYKSRAVAAAAQNPPELPSRHNIAKFEGTSRTGLSVKRPDRIPSKATVTLFPSGMDLIDEDCHCILAYVQDLDDWVLGALLGQINRGKKRMIKEYHPIIMDDPNVTIMPATEDELIAMIVARDDYKMRNN